MPVGRVVLPAHTGDSLWKKAATAIVYQESWGGVTNTIAISGYDSSIIAYQVTSLNTDEVIINAAIVWVNALGGGSVYIEESTYTFGANVALLASVYLYGSGSGSILTIPAATDDCVEISGVTGWKIALLTLRTTGVGANDALSLVDADDGEIFSLVIDDSGQDGIIIDGDSSSVNIHDNNISGCTRYGINNSGDNNQIQGNRIDTTGDDGIWLQAGGTYCVIVENRISGWTGEGIDNDESTNQVAHNITAV